MWPTVFFVEGQSLDGLQKLGREIPKSVRVPVRRSPRLLRGRSLSTVCTECAPHIDRLRVSGEFLCRDLMYIYIYIYIYIFSNEMGLNIPLNICSSKHRRFHRLRWQVDSYEIISARENVAKSQFQQNLPCLHVRMPVLQTSQAAFAPA